MELDNTLVKSLLDPKTYKHETTGIELLETHASWVILTGDYAYKIKKPVNFGFLDFSDLKKRKFFCEKELELNSILAKEIYKKVIPISGTKNSPLLNDSTNPIEYSVVTRQFKQENLLNELEKKNKLTYDMMKQVAVQLANFHTRDAGELPDKYFASFELIHKEAEDNFIVCKELTKDKKIISVLDKVQNWSENILNSLKPLIKSRQDAGFVKPCHGDVHLNNMVLIDNKVILFDCIEFNDGFRYIDVMNDLAFIVMDLLSKNHPKFAYYIVNKYLERTGDYNGVQLLKFYISYRAMVKAKVALLTNDSETEMLFSQKLELAEKLTANPNNKIIIMHGISGSGKSFISKELSLRLSAIRIRSDVERKRLHKLNPNLEMYSREMDAITFKHLLALAETIYKSGYTAIVDATFITHDLRKDFIALHSKLNAPFIILSVCASFDTIKSRIKKRQAQGIDPSDAGIDVVEKQFEINEPLTNEEKIHAIEIDANVDEVDFNGIIEKILVS